MQKPAASVIIAFYENIPFLEKVLAGYSMQNCKDFEIIIADDGSSDETVAAVNKLIRELPVPVQHVWHENQGWRKNRILNRAVLASRSDYLIFTDGDCIPHHAFVTEHLHVAEKGYVLAGRRVYLSERISNFITSDKIRKKVLKRFGLLLLVSDYLSGDSKHIENGIYFKSSFIRKRINRKEKGVLGSNFSLHKETLLSVNGFDERYHSPAVGEDTDIEYRLRNAGFRIKPVKHLAIQYHLYHKTLPRDKTNMDYLNEVIRRKITFTPYGIDQSGITE